MAGISKFLVLLAGIRHKEELFGRNKEKLAVSLHMLHVDNSLLGACCCLGIFESVDFDQKTPKWLTANLVSKTGLLFCYSCDQESLKLEFSQPDGQGETHNSVIHSLHTMVQSSSNLLRLRACTGMY